MEQLNEPHLRSESFFFRLLRVAAPAAPVCNDIEARVRGRYKRFRIGITNRPIERINEHIHAGRDCRSRTIWPVESLEVARYIEREFINRGMMGGTGGHTSPNLPVFVYVI